MSVLNYLAHISRSATGAGRRTLPCIAALLLTGSIEAAQTRAHLGVSATVLPVARMQVTAAPADIQVSADDLRRGYVDVLQPTSLVIASNSPDGFALDLMTLSPIAAAIIVNGLDSDQSLGADGGTLVQRWQGPQAMRVTLRFRLLLAPGLRVGRYDWPVKLGVRPL